MFDLAEDEARLLLNIALMATGQNRFRSAGTILDVLERFRPEAESLGTSRAVLLASAGRNDAALDYIDRVALPRWPASAMIRVFRGLILHRLGRDAEARPDLEEASASDDPAAANLAAALLENLP